MKITLPHAARYFPAIGANVSAQRQQSPQTSNTQFNNALLNLYNASVGVSYLLDVFGGTRRAVEAAGAQVDNQRYQLEATYLTLIANVLTAAIQEASLAAQIEAIDEIIAVPNPGARLDDTAIRAGARWRAAMCLRSNRS